MKAILVLNEMPKSCYACPLTYIDYDYGANTTRCVIDKDTIPRDGKWDECPLKKLPEIKYINLNDKHDDLIFQMGWNACLDEIMGKTE